MGDSKLILSVLTGLWLFNLSSSTNCIPQTATNCSETLRCYKPHEFVRYEKAGCDNNTCATALSEPRFCPLFIEKVPAYCDCESGYFRDSKGNCVTRQQCMAEQNSTCYPTTGSGTLRCYKPHEFVRYEKAGCDNNTCATALSGPRPCAQYIAKVPAYCDCVSGYFRDSYNNCVTREQCQREKGQTTLPCNPGNLRCIKPNEEIKCYHEIAACSNTTCESALRPRVVCNFLLPPQIDPHCGCKDGFFYDFAQRCVTRQECVRLQHLNQQCPC